MSRSHLMGLLCAVLASAGSPTDAADMQTVTIRFAGMVGDQPFACGETYQDVGTTHARVTPSDFRLLVSTVQLIDPSGGRVPLQLDQDGKWQHHDVALLDFENKSGPCANGTPDTRFVITGSAPRAAYAGLAFTLGVPPALNHRDATIADSPLNLTAMFWNWQGGYKFLRIDLATDGMPQRASAPVGMAGMSGMSDQSPMQPPMAAGTAGGHGRGDAKPGFLVHVGSTGCNTGPRGATGPGLPTCSNANRAEIVLPRFDSASNVVLVDLKALLKDTDVDHNQPQTAPGCMSEPFDKDCAGIMANLGLGFDGAPPTAQSVFRVK